MIDERERFERAFELFRMPEPPFERLLRRRDRKRRNRRIAAGVVGLAIGLAAILAGASVIRSSGNLPANPTPTQTLPQLRRGGEVAEGGFNYQVFGGVKGSVGLFAVDPETGDRRTLADCSDPCNGIGDPMWSPDGTRIAYFLDACSAPTQCEPENGIWVMDAFGRVQLTSCPNSPHLPMDHFVPGACIGPVWGLPLLAWFPDGTRIAYLSRVSLTETNLMAVDVEGSNRTVLVSSMGVLPLWSPDGTRFAYVNDGQLYVMPTEGGDSTLVAGTGSIGPVGPSGSTGGFQISAVTGWSPDGTSILFSSNEGIGDVNADGSERRVLVDGTVNELGPAAWSPDGTKIAWVSTPEVAGKGFKVQAWVMSADGSNQTRLFEGDCCIGSWDGPTWSPHGTQVAFMEDSHGPEQWWAAPADGSSPPTKIDPLIAEGWRQAP